MKIAIASNHRGLKSKNKILAHLSDLNQDVRDFGPFNDHHCDYPDYAAKVALAVSKGEVDRGILIGGTGIGMSIVANKFRGIRAALCVDELSTEVGRRQNDTNILCLSSNHIGDEIPLITIWLATAFEGGRHSRRIAKISEIEQSIKNGNQIS